MAALLIIVMLFGSAPLSGLIGLEFNSSDLLISASASNQDLTIENNVDLDLVESSGDASQNAMKIATYAAIETPITPDDESNASKYGICEYFTGWYDGGNPTAGAIRRNYALRIVKIYEDGTFYGIGYVLPRSGSSTANGSYYLKGNINFSNMTLSWQGYEWIQKISDSFDFLNFYNGSINETNNVLTGNTEYGDVTLTSDQNQLDMVFDKLELLTGAEGFRIIVSDKNGRRIDGATVTIYNGTNILAQKQTNNGDAVFLDISASKNKNATVSAHYSLGNGIELCSENLSSKGVWEGVKLSNLSSQNTMYLVVDEPRQVVSLSVGYVGKNDTEKKKRYSKISSVIEKYSEYLAQMTNGHCLLSNATIDAYSSDIELNNSSTDYDIYIFDDPANTINLNITTASTYIGYFIVFNYNNGYLDSKVLTHESGHYFFNFFDEYISGSGKGQNGGEKWNNKPVTNYGVMDNEWKSLEFSTSNTYSYLNDSNRSNMDMVTKHYANYGESTEETFANYLLDLCNGLGEYTFSNGKHTASYSYSKINIEGYQESSLQVINDGIQLEDVPLINSNIDDLNIIDSDTDSSVKIKINDTAITNAYVFDGTVFEELKIANNEISIRDVNSVFQLILVSETGSVKEKKIYNMSYNDGVFTANTKVDVSFDNLESIDNLVSVSFLEGISSYKLKRSINSFDNYASAKWYKIEDGTFVELDTTVECETSEADKGGQYYSCTVSESGKYILMGTLPTEEEILTVSNFKISNNKTTGIIDISFDESSKSVDSYILYYSTESIEEAITNDSANVSISFDNNISAYVDIPGTYNFALMVKYENGNYKWYKNLPSYVYKLNDSNNDGIPDIWFDEYYMLEDSATIANVDLDEDGLTNLQEYQLGTNPVEPDTDGDNVYDGIEVENNLDPLKVKTNDIDYDYIVLYGQPDLEISNVGLADDDLIFTIKNLAEGAAIRTNIKIQNKSEILYSWEVNLRAYDKIDITVPVDVLTTYDNFNIVVDERHIIYDVNYSNNEMIVGISDTFSFANSEETMVKKNTETLQTVVNHDYHECFKWESSNSNIVSVDNYGNITANKIGIATITATNLRGYSRECEIYVVAFEGAEYSEFDSTLLNDSEVAIIGYIGSDADISIPNTIGGYPVTRINSSAFSGCSIENVSVHAGINYISTSAFSNTSNLKNITVDADNAAYCSKDGVLFDFAKTSLIKYPSAREDSDYVIPESVNTIENSAFRYCQNLKRVDLSNVETVNANAFYDSGLTELTIPEGVTYIGSSAFYCYDLTTVNYNAVECEIYSSFLGLLIRSYRAFGENIKNLVIGDKVEKIPSYLLFDCTIEEIIVPSSVKVIGSNAFYNCYGLTIKAYANSCAKDYAEANGYNFVPITCGNCVCEEWEISTDATCTSVGEKTGICLICGAVMTDEIPMKDHNYGNWVTTKEATCKSEGTRTKTCTECKNVVTETIPKLAHTDKDNDGICDSCGAELKTIDPSANCTHICHNKNSFVQFIYKIVRFFWKLFGINKYCSCGYQHY